MKITNKPIKKSDEGLFELLIEKIDENEYVFLNHAKMRLIDRKISDLDIINILGNKPGYRRKRNKRKDTFQEKTKIGITVLKA